MLEPVRHLRECWREVPREGRVLLAVWSLGLAPAALLVGLWAGARFNYVLAGAFFVYGLKRAQDARLHLMLRQAEVLLRRQTAALTTASQRLNSRRWS